MIIDALINGSYNKKFAQLAGLQTAVYFSELIQIFERVVEKKTYDKSGFFKLDRKYVQKQTTLTVAQQTEADAVLVKLGLLEIDPNDPDLLRAHMNEYLEVLTASTTAEKKEISKVAKSATKVGKTEGKRAGIISRLKASMTETDSEVLKAYYDWVEVVYDKGVVRAEQVKIFKEIIDNYTTSPEIKINIIKIATSCAYKEAAWAIGVYEKQYGKKLPTQKVATEVSNIRI